MNKSALYFDKLEVILDKEHEFLLQTRREHHSSWDNHILTLSTAAVGFSFTFLPLSNSSVFWLAIVGIFSFVASVVFTTFNYIMSDNGIELASKSHSARRMQHAKVLRRKNQLEREIEKFRPEDEKNVNAARNKFLMDVDNIYAERDPEKEIRDIEKINNKIRVLNHAKTYSFLGGVIAITSFSLCNISLFSK